MTPCQVFDGEDDDYYRWLDEHPHGFVLNTRRSRSPAPRAADASS